MTELLELKNLLKLFRYTATSVWRADRWSTILGIYVLYTCTGCGI